MIRSKLNDNFGGNPEETCLLRFGARNLQKCSLDLSLNRSGFSGVTADYYITDKPNWASGANLELPPRGAAHCRLCVQSVNITLGSNSYFGGSPNLIRHNA